MTSDKRSYLTVLCMGYIKPWVTTKPTSPTGMSSVDDDVDDIDSDGVNLNSLIAVGVPLDLPGDFHHASINPPPPQPPKWRFTKFRVFYVVWSYNHSTMYLIGPGE